MTPLFFVFKNVRVPFEGGTEFVLSGSAGYVVTESNFGKEATFVSVTLHKTERLGERLGPDGEMSGLTPDALGRLSEACLERLNRDFQVRDELAERQD